MQVRKERNIEFLRRWLEEVEELKREPRFCGLTFPNVTDGDLKAEEFWRSVQAIVTKYDQISATRDVC